MNEFPYDRTARTEDEIRKAVDDLLKQMTLEEKVGQLVQSPGPATADIGMDVQQDPMEDLIREGKIGSTIFIAPAQDIAGQIEKWQKMAVEESRLRIPLLFCQDVIHGYQTVFPIPLGRACSFDMPAIEKAARIAAKEASCAGLHVRVFPHGRRSPRPPLGPGSRRRRGRSVPGFSGRTGCGTGIPGGRPI